MDVGIRTLDGFDLNFGTWLQTYALRRFIERSFPCIRCFHISREPFRKIFAANDRFGRFMEGSRVVGFSDVPSFDKIVVGSDLVAAYNQDWFDFDGFFMDGAEGVDRIMYAGGSCEHPAGRIPDEVVSGYFSRFRSISVRELGTYDKMKDDERLTFQRVTYNVDPVFLLGSDEWRSLARKPDLDVEPGFAAQYNPHSGSRPNRGVELYGNPKIGPAEFLWMVMNCGMFTTTSFHGVCFSIIFGKKANIPYIDYKVENLFRLLEIRDYGDIDYGHVMSIIKSERARALRYFEESFSAES